MKLIFKRNGLYKEVFYPLVCFRIVVKCIVNHVIRTSYCGSFIVSLYFDVILMLPYA